jgi:anaerobic magnesium-protoporphyrin IX monomethyl ester cyclase
VSEVFYSEPLGVMQLSAILKGKGHRTRMAVLKLHSLVDEVTNFSPDLIAYSVMSPDLQVFKNQDKHLRRYLTDNNLAIRRIMGGPHPTYFQKVLEEFDLDAICVGEGDNAMLRIIERNEFNSNFSNIPNVLSRNDTCFEKEIIHDLDALPFIDRDIFYEAAPDYRDVAIRSVLTSRGCPYFCTYCFNHAYNKMFKDLGPILRRRSVESVIEELKLVIRNYQPVKMIRFGDDTFVYKADNWLEEFIERYHAEIHVPFYCLMRSNTLTDDVARMLAYAGCKSVGMSLETGSEDVRNKILRRNLSDQTVKESFAIARKYHLRTYGNSMLGIPGTTLKEDFHTIRFSRQLKISVPSFGVFSPYPGTDLTNHAIQQGLLDCRNSDFQPYRRKTILNGYSEKEKGIMLNLAYLGTFFYFLPGWWQPLLKMLVRLPLTGFYGFLNSFFISYLLSTKVFPGAHPRKLSSILKHIGMATKYWMTLKTRET